MLIELTPRIWRVKLSEGGIVIAATLICVKAEGLDRAFEIQNQVLPLRKKEVSYGMKYRVAISGSYGGMNLGDEAILEVILRELRASLDVDVVVFSRNAKDTEQRHKVRAVPIREMHKDDVFEELRKLDLFILGGGGILFDGLVEDMLRDVNWARELGIPVMVYAISVGPLKTPESKQLVVTALSKVDKITVRENEAKRILHDLGLNRRSKSLPIQDCCSNRNPLRKRC